MGFAIRVHAIHSRSHSVPGYRGPAARWLLCLPALFLVFAAHAFAADEPLAPRIANYRIEARLDPEARTVTGRQVLRWHNSTKQTAKELQFHLYLNAFSNNQTTLMAALPKMAERWAKRFPGEWGGIDVTGIRIGDEDLTDLLEFVQPDDGNPYDRTVARLPLKRSIRAGRSVEVEMDFVARLPRVFVRAGHAAPFFLVAQWYPKIGVFEGGEWTCHQYHATTEFYADFGEYEVSLTLPADFVVGHTGEVVGERDNEDGTKTVDVKAEDVHDFAWAADPRFHVIEDHVNETKVRLLMQPGHVEQSQRYFDALRSAMSRYRKWFGPYPYPALTVIDPGAGVWSAGAMGYPMMFTAATTWWLPTGVRLPRVHRRSRVRPPVLVRYGGKQRVRICLVGCGAQLVCRGPHYGCLVWIRGELSRRAWPATRRRGETPTPLPGGPDPGSRYASRATPCWIREATLV